jgi:hypothetical protein
MGWLTDDWTVSQTAWSQAPHDMTHARHDGRVNQCNFIVDLAT